MERNIIQAWFDEAFALMKNGDFASAAACFMEFIEKYKKKDPYAASKAEYYLRWYCLPVNKIYNTLQDSGIPLDINDFVKKLFETYSDYSLDEYKENILAIERELTQQSVFIKFGQGIWVLDKDFENCVQAAIRDLEVISEPILLSTLIRNYWPSFSDNHPAFPDKIGVTAFAEALRENDFLVIANRFAISKSALGAKKQLFFRKIEEHGKPVNLCETLPLLFAPNLLSEENRRYFEYFFSLHLDNKFIEVSPGIWFLIKLLDLDKDPCKKILDSPLPLSIEDLLIQKLFHVDELSLYFTSTFLKKALNLLSKNKHLIQIGTRYWASKEKFSELQEYAIGELKDSEMPLSTDLLVDSEIKRGFSNISLLSPLLIEIEDFLQSHPEVIPIKNGLWLHKSTLNRVVDKGYEWLLQEGGPKSTTDLFEFAFDYQGIPNLEISSLINLFKRTIYADSRFIYDRSEKKWRAISSTKIRNNLAFSILQSAKKPLSLAEISDIAREKHGISEPKFDLDSDNRFKKYLQDRWIRSDWTIINDLAYEYLSQSKLPLHQKTIIGYVCENNGLDIAQAVFIPENDPRFVSAPHNRWKIIYQVTDHEINQLLRYLSNLGDKGITLENLVEKVLHTDAAVTDAARKIANDERFLKLNDKWYAREAAFYYLSLENIDQLYNYLTALQKDQLPISLSDLVWNALDLQADLTDALEKISGDSRFIEIRPGFWAHSNYKPPEFTRRRIPVPQVSNQPTTTSVEEKQISLPEELTKRKRRKSKRKNDTPPKSVTLTLDHLDIRHGNIRVTSELAHFIPDKAEAINLVDEEYYQFTGILDDTRSLLMVSHWLKRRNLTYGDKIVIQPTDDPMTLSIYPKGERDERIYSEAVRHQDVEKLIEEAETTKQSYHDLMIDVMEAIGGKLHREDIYQLVDYHRTAHRSYIFSLLSLVDCPYEELRYFVPHGNGYWSFDRKRKEAFDMKMKELESQVDELRAENKHLSERMRKQRLHLKTLEAAKKDTSGKVNKSEKQVQKLQDNLEKVVGELEKRDLEIAELQKDKSSLSNKISNLQRELKDAQSFVREKNSCIEDLERQNSELATSKEGQAIEIERLNASLEKSQDQVKKLEGKIIEYQKLIEQIKTEQEQLQSRNEELHELNQDLVRTKTKLQSEVETAQKNLQTTKEQSQIEISRLQDLALKLSSDLIHLEETEEYSKKMEKETAELQLNLSQLQGKIDALIEEGNDLKLRLSQLNKALNTPLGKLFSMLSGL